MITAFDPLVIAAALLVLFVGTKRRLTRWREWGAPDEAHPGDGRALLSYLAGHRRILQSGKAGIAHLLLFWGILIPFLIAVLAQFAFGMPHWVAWSISFLGELAGLAALIGILFFLYRRIISPGKSQAKRTVLPATVLFAILISGFMAEGTRLSLVPQPFYTAPVGWFFSTFLPSSPLFMQIMIRLHFFSVLFLLAILPFTFMRHVPAGFMSIYYKRKEPVGALRPLRLEEGRIGASEVRDLTWKQLLEVDACVSCGRCEENCPAYLSGKPLSPRKVIGKILVQMEVEKGRENASVAPRLLEEDILAEEIWACTTCMACIVHCPLFIEPMDKVLEMRRYQTLGRGLMPVEARPMIRNLELFGDVNGKGVAHKEEWALHCGVPKLSAPGSNPEVLLWVGCSGAFHPRYQEITRDMVKILKAGGVTFGILGKEELCCGDPARRLGEEALFLDLALKNVNRLKQYRFQKLVALCPHCFNVLKNEYPKLDGVPANFEVIHAAQLILSLLEENRIVLKYPVKGKAAFHDPCYLGRANGIYGFPREILRAVPGLELKELGRNSERGFCCGGGGGRMWLHEGSGSHVNRFRAQEVAETGVDLVSTACPYCLTMLDDGLSSLEMEKRPRVRDIIEITASSLG